MTFYNENSSYLGFMYRGSAIVKRKREGMPSFEVFPGCYFAVNEPFELQIKESCHGFIVEVPEYNAMAMTGGPIDEHGRLKYIDGCTDSLLIPPVKKENPCLNHLHFPPGIDQTMHTHPTARVGMVVKGEGECVTPWGGIPLYEGQTFVILPSDGESHKAPDGKYYETGSHCFRTFEKTMDVIAFHPDSDFGPEDEDHPMINRTMVNGVSAATIDSIRTK